MCIFLVMKEHDLKTNRLELKNFFSGYNNYKNLIVSEYKTELVMFFDKFFYRKNLFDTFKEKSDMKLSSDFNTFDFIKIDELGLSKIIAVLLDAKGIHGQGSLFLDLFILCFGSHKLNKLKNRNFKVYKEYSTNTNRRIDILLKGNDFAIIIENKPYTGDQKDQITDYIEYMETNHQPNYKDRLFTIYLNKSGSEPNNFSDESKLELLKSKQNNNEFKIVTYDAFAKIYLQECYEKCKSEKFRYFIGDFIDFINKNPNFINEEGTGNGQYEK